MHYPEPSAIQQAGQSSFFFMFLGALPSDRVLAGDSLFTAVLLEYTEAKN